MQLDALFQQAQALPTIPKVAQQLIQSFNDEDVAVSDIIRAIATDQVLSARLLRLANSAYYHVSRTVASVQDAVTMLGFINVRTLVISTGLTGGFKSIPGMDLKRFWRHSLHTSVAARHLAKQIELNSDLAFTVGLMHAIGQLVMHVAMPEAMLQADKTLNALDPRRVALEQQSFGYSYFEVSAELARRWKFPEEFAQAIAAAKQPLDGGVFDPVGALVHIAAWRSRAEENHLNAEEIEAGWPADVGARLGLPLAALLQDLPDWAELSAGMEELIS
jgi:putative nucleotidyltransferase with HDIG domain